jgi:hypothetical protein
MTTYNQSSFLDIALHGSQELAIAGLIDGKKNTSKFQAAKLISQMQDKHQCPVPNAIVATFFDQNRKQLQNNNTVHSFVVLGLVQDLMNKVCWIARSYDKRVASAQMVADAIGRDYSQEASTELDIEDHERFDVTSIVDTDYRILLSVQTDIVSTMDNIDWQMLSYFQQSEPNPNGSGAWITTVQARSFAEAGSAMDDVLELLKEKQQGEQRQREDSALTKDYASQPAGVMKDVSKPPASAPKQTDIDESDIPFGEEASA